MKLYNCHPQAYPRTAKALVMLCFSPAAGTC